MRKDKINSLCRYLDENKHLLYPIQNTILEDETDYIKNNYLKLIAVVLQQSKDISENQLSLFKRIVAGSKTEKTTQDYLRMALDIEVKDLLDFANDCKKTNIGYRFILDLLIITSCNNKDEEQIKLVADITELFEVELNELKYLTIMAHAIVEMSQEKYVDAYEIKIKNKIETISNHIFSDYMYLVIKSNIRSNGNMTIYQPDSKECVTVNNILDILKNHDTPIVMLIDVDVNVEECLKFIDKKCVIFKNCRFVGGYTSLSFKNCENIFINNTRFENFRSFTLSIDNVQNISIDNSYFKYCICEHSNSSNDWEIFGCVIHNAETTGNGFLNLLNTTFENCGGRNYKSHFRSAFICDMQSNVRGCKFINCWHWSNGYIDPDVPSRTMFVKSSKAIDCIFENSAKFC